MQSSQRLPPEICDKIIDASLSVQAEGEPVDYWKHTLGQLSRVCRAWVPRSRYWLFKHIILGQGMQYFRFSRLLTGNPSIGQHVQQLTLNVGDALSDWQDLIAHINKHLPNVTVLHLIQGAIAEPLILQDFAGIRELRLTSVTIHSWDIFRAWLQSMPNIEEITVLSMYANRISKQMATALHDESTSLPVVPHLTRLRLMDDGLMRTSVSSTNAKFMNIITSNRSPPLKKLELGNISAYPLRAGWLRSIAPTLEFLKTSIDVNINHPLLASFLSFNLCDRLRKLDLAVNEQGLEQAFAIETSLLSTLASANLKELYLRPDVRGKFTEPSLAPHWREFVNTLRSPKFSGLEVFFLGFTIDGVRRDRRTRPLSLTFMSEVRNSFPEFTARGVLRLVDDYQPTFGSSWIW